MMEEMMTGMGGRMAEMFRRMIESSCASICGTSEIRHLFEEWLKVLEEEAIAFIKEKGKISLEDLASKLKISTESALFLIAKLAREGKLIIGEIRVA